MQEATEANVLGNFDNTQVQFHNISTRFYKSGNEYFLETLAIDGKVKPFKVLYTFGYQPLQQYLVDIGKGKLQASISPGIAAAKQKVASAGSICNPTRTFPLNIRFSGRATSRTGIADVLNVTVQI